MTVSNHNELQPSEASLLAQLQKENRGLKRKLALAEATMQRAHLIASAQERSETILSASLKKEIQFFQLVLENATNILLLLDFDGRFAYASRTFLLDAGIPSLGLIQGRQYQEVLRPVMTEENLARLTSAVDYAVMQKSTVSLEEQIDFNHQALHRTFSILITPMLDEDGTCIGIMALFNDITEINNALEAAKRANLAKSDFLANMSHEIRTPLNAIIGMAAIAQSSDDMEKIHYCLGKVNDSSTHLLGVINDILDMSKIESKHFELSFSEFIFEKMLLRIVDVMRFKIEEKNISFELYCDPRVPYAVLSDEQRLAQVIMNIMSNAVKFTPENGRISLRAEVQSVQGDEYTLIVSIQDSGIGISEEQKPRLFKVFSQADSSISRKFGGTGLGLAISKNIINLLGGEIWLDSREGEGTTFSFTIKTQACQLSPKPLANRENVHMLVVDDMPEVRMTFALYAEKLGIACTTAESAEKALEILKEQPHEIVFVDWKMPGMDGLTLAKKLSANDNSDMVIIMISAADWTDVEKEAKNAGVKSFISKPILLPIIENVLNQYCEDRSTKKENAHDDFSGKTILLADDVEINREITIALLENTGVHILCAENGKEAVDMFAASPDAFDLIFMDVQMPEMDGYEATQRIRALDVPTAKTVPIVAMTANVFKEDVERCLASGMNDHVGKPLNLEEILAKLKQYLG